MSQALPLILGSLHEDLMSLLSSKALLGGEYIFLVQIFELGKGLLGSGFSFLHKNYPIIVELSNYISTVEC